MKVKTLIPRRAVSMPRPSPRRGSRSALARPVAGATRKKPMAVGQTGESRTTRLWHLRLYVIDGTPKSQEAFANLKEICETHLKGHYRITVIDLMKHPQLAKGDQILAIPTVVRRLPIPVRTIIGSLSDAAHVLVGLDLRAAD